MSNRFDSLLNKYHDPATSEFDKGVAKGSMNEIDNARMQWNKEHNPSKYNADMAARAKKSAEYYEKAARGEKAKPVKAAKAPKSTK